MKVISVKFKENGRSYYFDPCDFEIKEGDYVIVTTARGTECGEVVRAIRWHTTGRADMSVMEKILYIADYAEPTRDFPGVERLRAALVRSLDEAVLLGLSMTMEQLRLKGQTVCRDSRAAYDFLRKKG